MKVPLFRYYQKTGGQEPWTPVRYTEDLSAIKPTFVTILGLDTLMDSDPTQEQKDRIRYYGPLYFDIDAKSLTDSIESANELYSKLIAAGLTEHDIEIYCSGKKGFHLLVPPECFMEKPDEPVVRLPAIYKEMALKFAVRDLDFRVYTAQRGRMLRTVYNQRENGLYKVAISADQLRSMTEESYVELAAVPTGPATVRPGFSGKFSLAYTAAVQKVTNWKPRKAKPPSAEVLKRDLGVVNRILRNECKGGFNRIAIQLAVYAREVGWTEDQLVNSAKDLIQGHESDSSRYATPSKRAAELRRMCQYVEDNQGYAYSSAHLSKLLTSREQLVAAPADAASEEPGEATEGEPTEAAPDHKAPDNRTTSQHQGIQVSLEGIFSDNGSDLRQLSNASLGNLSVSHVINGEVSAIRADVYVDSELTASGVSFPTDSFTSSAGLHRELVRFGSGFWGTDMDARGVLAALQNAGAPVKTELLHCGLDLVKLPNSQHAPLQEGVLVWAGKGGCVAQAWAAKLADFSFSEDASHQGVPDLLDAPHPRELLATSDQKRRLVETWRALWESNDKQTIGQVYGWMAACFWRSLIHAATDQYPLLHVAGAAGYGKTQNIRLAASMHTYRVRLPEATPNSTPFALGQLLSCYTSAPVLLDEYKPHRMSETRLEGFRSLLRDAYNGKASLRGGGAGAGAGQRNQGWRNLSATYIKAPVIFIAEALETETAILERSVPVTFTRRRGRGDTFSKFTKVQENKDILASLGRALVEDILATASVAEVSAEMAKITAEMSAELRQPQDSDSAELARARRNITERPLHNTAVTIFGLGKLHSKVLEILAEAGGEFAAEAAEFQELHDQAVEAMKAALLEASATAMPEMIKFLIDVAEIAKGGELLRAESACLVEHRGELFLQVVPRQVFNGYRRWVRSCGAQAYYATPESVIHALRNFDGYRAALSDAERTLLEWSTLQDYGMTSWHTRAVPYR